MSLAFNKSTVVKEYENEIDEHLETKNIINMICLKGKKT